MQTNSVGRGVSAETETIADTVTPCRPATPSVVTTLTVHAAWLMPSRNCCLSAAMLDTDSAAVVAAAMAGLRSRFGGAGRGFRPDTHDPFGQAGRLAHEIEGAVPVEIAVDGCEMGIRGRLGEQLERQAGAGVVGVEQVAGESQQLTPVVGDPIVIDAVVLVEPRL